MIRRTRHIYLTPLGSGAFPRYTRWRWDEGLDEYVEEETISDIGMKLLLGKPGVVVHLMKYSARTNKLTEVKILKKGPRTAKKVSPKKS